MVRYDDFRAAMEFEDVLNEQKSILFCYNVFMVGSRMHHICQMIDEYGNGRHPVVEWCFIDLGVARSLQDWTGCIL